MQGPDRDAFWGIPGWAAGLTIKAADRSRQGRRGFRFLATRSAVLMPLSCRAGKPMEGTDARRGRRAHGKGQGAAGPLALGQRRRGPVRQDRPCCGSLDIRDAGFGVRNRDGDKAGGPGWWPSRWSVPERPLSSRSTLERARDRLNAHSTPAAFARAIAALGCRVDTFIRSGAARHMHRAAKAIWLAKVASPATIIVAVVAKLFRHWPAGPSPLIWCETEQNQGFAALGRPLAEPFGWRCRRIRAQVAR